MIIIKTKNDYEFKYKGTIRMRNDDPFITIEADIVDSMAISKVSIHVFDKFFIEEVISITSS
jgi:hypothetical protein